MSSSINVYYSHVAHWDIESLSDLLSDEEKQRLSAIKHPPTLHRKSVSRVLLKNKLMNDFGVPSDKLSFHYNERGKPILSHYPRLHFNTSQSHDLVMIGISSDCLIGVDLELIKEIPNEEGVAKTFFSTEEYLTYCWHRRRAGQFAFYQFWTLKEAIIKALGKGLWEADKVPSIEINQSQFLLKSCTHEQWAIRFMVKDDYCSCIVGRTDSMQVNTFIVNSIPGTKTC